MTTEYVATIIALGHYMPAEDPPAFDTAKEAWEYLAEIRRGEEDAALVTIKEDDSYSSTVYALMAASRNEQNLIGTIYGATPGDGSAHDLGLAYSVGLVEQ